MNQKKKISGLLAILAVFVLPVVLQFCVKPPNYPDEPVITFKSLSKNFLKQKNLGKDSFVIRLAFTDGDGDIGSNDATGSVFLTDTRDNVEKLPYSLPLVDQQGAGNGISGDIEILFTNDLTCCISELNGIPVACDRVPVSRDTLSFRITIQDRAGHRSNVVETTPIYLICKQ